MSKSSKQSSHLVESLPGNSWEKAFGFNDTSDEETTPDDLTGILIDLALIYARGELTDKQYHKAVQELTGGKTIPNIENHSMRISYEDILTNQELGDSSRFTSNDARLSAFKEMVQVYNEFSKGEPRRAFWELIGNFNPHHDQQGRFTDEASSTTGKVVQSHTGRGGVQSHTGREGSQSHTGREGAQSHTGRGGAQSHTGRTGPSSKEKEDHERASDEFADTFDKQEHERASDEFADTFDKQEHERASDEFADTFDKQVAKEKSGHALGASKLSGKLSKSGSEMYGKANARAASAHADAASAHAAAGNHELARMHGDVAKEHASLAKRHGITGNSYLANQEFDMTREADITWLTTNCDCWKGNGDLETLNMLSDEKLATMKDVARRSLAEKYALRRGFKVGKKHYTWNAATGRFDTKKVVKAGVEQAGGKDQEDEYNVNADDEEYDSDDEDDMDEDDDDDVAKRFRGMKDTRNNGSGRGRTTMNMQQWESSMPPEARRVWNLAKSVEANTRNTLIQQLIANVYGDKERHLLYNTLKNKSMQELQVLANLVPPSIGYGTPDFIPQSYVGASVPAHNRANTNDSESDVLPLPTINFSEWAKGNSGS